MTDKPADSHRNILAIGWVSFFVSAGSLMVYAVWPTFLNEELGASKTTLGMIEGAAIFIAFISKVFSGVLADYFRQRKPLIIIGTIGSLLVKAMFAVSFTISMAFAARFLGRIAKGVRSAPADALVADWSPEEKRATHFGLRQALLTAGQVLGALAAGGIMYYWNDDYRLVFWFSSIAVAIGLLILIIYVRDKPRSYAALHPKTRWSFEHLRHFPAQYWLTLVVIAAVIAGRFSESFISLRLRETGWSVALIPIMFAVMDIFHALIAYPSGKWADARNRFKTLANSLILLIIADLCLALSDSVAGAVAGVILIGLHLGINQGLMRALISSAIPFEMRGTAFSLFYLVSAVAILFGNTTAGWLAEHYSTAEAFVFQAVMAALAIALIYGLMSAKKVLYK